MTELDTLARAATRELLERSAVDVPQRWAELRRVRSRRTAAKLGAVSVAVALAVGGWQLASSPTREPQPAPAPVPVKVVNGALLALKTTATWITVLGHPPAFQPRDSESYATVQFTPDGKFAVYADQVDRITMLDVTTGEERMLVRCPPSTSCRTSSLSPDGRVLAFGSDKGLELMQVDTGELQLLQPAGIRGTFRPTWAPDARSLAFISGPDLYSTDTDGRHLTLLYTASGRHSVLQDLSWSPDGKRIAFLEGAQVDHSINGDHRFTAMTLDLSDGAVTELRDAGHCYCLGLAPPSLTWSPDGELIAVATTQGMLGGPGERAVGVYTIHPDGTGWTQVSGGLFDGLAWQPLIE